jgi:hypothetical protein
MAWPPPVHLFFALASGLVCWIVAALFNVGISPSHAAIFGAVVAYPALIFAWWLWHRSSGR